MAQPNQFQRAERELRQGLANLDERNPAASEQEHCPSETVLRRFVDGKCGKQEALGILDHLGCCQSCILYLEELRWRRKLTKSVVLALAASAAILIAVWAVRGGNSLSTLRVQTVDLRLVSPTRGLENPPASPVVVARNATGLRLILPIGSEGKYEFQIRPDRQGRIVARGSGTTRIEAHTVVLNLRVDLGSLDPGRYSLALRREHYEWSNYSIDLK